MDFLGLPTTFLGIKLSDLPQNLYPPLSPLSDVDHAFLARSVAYAIYALSGWFDRDVTPESDVIHSSSCYIPVSPELFHGQVVSRSNVCPLHAFDKRSPSSMEFIWSPTCINTT